MTEAARAARNEYYRQYRAQHKEQIRETKRRYWERVAARKAKELITTELEERSVKNG